MVIVSAKVSKKKVLAAVLAAICVIALLVFLTKRSEEAPAPAETAQAQSLSGGSNEERLAFLSSFGWEVMETPKETQEVRIPEEFNDVFLRYNELQQSQGFDLSEYAGKTAKRYVYTITNHPDGTMDHFATLLVYKGTIIGGDVTCTASGGTMSGFQMPQN